MWCVLEVKGRAGRRPGGAVGLGSRGQGCASCWGRTFIKDGCILISVICDRTQSSCGKYVLTGPLRQRCRHVEAVGEPVGDTAANRLCSPNVRRARGARAVRCPHSGHERLHGHHASRKTAECCGSCAGPDAGAEFMSAAWTPPAGSAQIRQGICLGTMPARSGRNWQRTVCFRDGWIRHRLATPRGSGATIQELSVLSGAGLSCGTSMSRQVAPSPRVVAVGMTSPGPGRSLRLRDGCSHLAIWDSTD